MFYIFRSDVKKPVGLLFCAIIVMTSGIELNYVFTNFNGFYTCQAENLVIKNRNEEITAVTGDHKQGRKNSFVEVLQIINQKVKVFPANVSKWFKFLVSVNITQSDLKSSIMWFKR